MNGPVRPAGSGYRLLVPLALLLLLCTSCSQETRDELRQAASSITVALPTAIPTRTEASGPSGATGPTSQPTEEPTSPPTEEPTKTVPVEPTETPSVAPTAEPTIMPTEAPTAQPTEGPGGGGQGRFLLALIEILRRLRPPGPSPVPSATPLPSESPTGKPPKETPSPEPTTEPTEGPTGGTARVTGPTGAGATAGATGPTADNEGQEIAAAAVSSATEDSTTWIWLVAALLLGCVGLLVWRLTRRDRAHPPGPGA